MQIVICYLNFIVKILNCLNWVLIVKLNCWYILVFTCPLKVYIRGVGVWKRLNFFIIRKSAIVTTHISIIVNNIWLVAESMANRIIICHTVLCIINLWVNCIAHYNSIKRILRIVAISVRYWNVWSLLRLTIFLKT